MWMRDIFNPSVKNCNVEENRLNMDVTSGKVGVTLRRADLTIDETGVSH